MATPTDVNFVQFGSPAQVGRIPAETMTTLLDQLSGQLQARIADVENRHTEALNDLQGKLERMSGHVGRAKPQMPAELAVAFGRIETGMADLVERIAETSPERRRAAEAFVFGAVKTASNHFVFDPPRRQPVAPVAMAADPYASDPWDQSSAEALAHLYESGEAVLGKHLPEAALFARSERVMPVERMAAFDAAAPLASKTSAVAIASTPQVQQSTNIDVRAVAVGFAEHRDWVDQRLSGLAEQVARSINEARPDGALQTLMSRVDQLESRFTTALEGMASKSDVAAMRHDALGQVEAQIKEIAGHIENTHLQLTRLDTIEQHLTDLTAFAHASMDADQGAPAEETAQAEHDFAQLADMAVERALARAPQLQSSAIVAEPAETQARVNAVHTLLQEFAAERRRGDQYTTGMLETVQEALIRLIDRVDAIDASTARPSMTSTVVQAAQSAPIVVEAARPAVPEVASLAVDDGVAATEAFGARRSRTARGQALPNDTQVVAPAAAPVVEGQAQPEISIKDIRLNTKRVPITPAPARSEAPAVSEALADAEAEPKAKRNVRATPVGTAAGGAGKRSLYVAAAALSLVGIGFMAQHLYAGGETVPVPSAAGLPAKPTAAVEIGKSTSPVNPTAAKPGAVLNPPGMVIAPLPRPKAGATPPATDATSQRSDLIPQRAGDQNPIERQLQPKQPSSVPETVNDDLSMNDIEDTEAVAQPAANGQPARKSVASIQPMAGLAVAASGPTVTAQQISEMAGLQRQSNQAAASERIGSMARPASDFSQRFGVFPPIGATAPASAPSTEPAAAIVTGSNPLQRAQVQPANDASLTESVPETADLPPALVGPLSLRMAAAKGDPAAAFEVATRFAEGRGIKQDFKQAMTWYQRSANKGFAIAQYRLGTLYERGLGTPADPARARVWYKRAADQGNVKAMHNMAVLSAGNGQAAPDYASAAKWFKDAADRGLQDSQFNLAVLYENGLGVVKDQRTAYFWFSLAARNGDAEATRRRDAILATLDQATIQSANEQIQGWHARPSDAKINDARVAGDQWRNHAVPMDQQMAAQQAIAAAPPSMAVVQAPQVPAARTIKVTPQPR